MRRFEFVEGTSAKFWEIALAGSAFTVTWGRLGAAATSPPPGPTPAIAPKAKNAPKAPAPAPAPAAAEPGRVDLGNGYTMALVDGVIVVRNPKGKDLATLPKELKSHPLVEQAAE